jgi:hypothetical protein
MRAAAPEPRPPRRRTAALRPLVGIGVGVVILVAAVVVGRAGRWERREPTRPAQAAVTSSPVADSPAVTALRPSQYGARPLRGVPLRGPTGLRLLISGELIPIVLEVDRGTIQPITGLPTDKDRLVRIEAVGQDAIVVSERSRPVNDPLRVADVFWLRHGGTVHGGTVATRLGVGADAAASGDGRGVWLLSYRDQAEMRCILSQVGLDGRQRRPARPMPCQTRLLQEVPAGLLIDDGSALVNPGGGVVRLDGRYTEPAGGSFVLRGAEAGEPIILADLRGDARWWLDWPSQVDGPQAGMGPVRRHPDGRLAVVGFGDPADPGPEQALDVWLLDLTTRRWRQLPDMPARVAIKATDMRWTADGRLVILTELAESDEQSTVVAVWRPGEPRIAVRQVQLPQETGGSFVLW